MVVFSGLVVLVARLGLAMALPRTTEDRVLEVVERDHGGSVTREPYHVQRKFLHRGHHLRHKSRGSGPVMVPPEAEVRCYCNLPACVTTGFVCQSMVGSCFSENTDTDGRTHTRHGCLELLSRHKQHICERLQSQKKPDMRLRCCTEDMCNLADDAQVNTRTASAKHNVQRPVPTPPPELVNLSSRQGSRSGELWLRAATIAVPIVGLFILSVLVLLAVRMLRRESKPPLYQYAKAPLCALEPAADGDAPVAPPVSSGRLLTPPAPEARVDVHRTVCCVYATDPRCPHAAVGL